MINDLLEQIRKTFPDEIAHYRYLEPKHAEYAEPEKPVNSSLRDAFKKKGIDRFFSHQAKGIDLIRKGNNIVVMTPAASGKSLIYNIPVLESIIDNLSAKALYLFPLKGLEQDQIKTLRELASDIGITYPAEVYDGDTTAYRRKKIRETLPNIIFSNPDMLHLALNAFHAKWVEFFKNLRFVVIDEIHTYKGVFGSHVAQVLRRLRRICKYYGSSPQFIACSATIANPVELAGNLTGLDFELIDNNGAPRGGRHIVFLNPWGSPYTASTKAFKLCLDKGLKSIAFTKSRKITELMYSWLIEGAPEYETLVSSYRAGFLPVERREIEQRLFSGELKGVISTSALELGVDIGGLDVCILAGYPGSIASTWQRAGRAGRHGQDAVIIMVGLKDAIDQYFMRHSDDFFSRSHEAVVVDTFNPAILKQHIPCAAAEIYLRSEDTVYDAGALMPLINELENRGLLRAGKKGSIWFSPGRNPQREVSIRGIGKIFSVISGDSRIGEISGARIYKEAHPGAIYLHKGRQYRVEELDIENLKIHCREVDVPYYTQAVTREETEIIAELEKRKNISWGNLRTTHIVTGYWRKRLLTQEKLERYPVELPSWTFETQGLWITLSSKLEQKVLKDNLNFAGGLHAFEHTAISALPLFAMCDKGDIGGISYPLYPDFLMPAIFIYDGYEGGIGLTKRALEVIDKWLEATGRILTECPCEDGCPSCVQDPQCGSGNEPLDKKAAVLILNEIKKELL
ncbi:MAG: DEAD/DEAH box helicase [Nitrospirae bacterium]|nr:DEAD/DEAH box helicase [Nitrospirota bacterium]